MSGTTPTWALAIAAALLGLGVIRGIVQLSLLVVAHRSARTLDWLRAQRAQAIPPALQPPISVLLHVGDDPEATRRQVQALLRLGYRDYELIVVADAERHRQAVTRMLADFAMHEVPVAIRRQLRSEPARAIYRSRRWSNLRLIDKPETTEADAFNAALDAARWPLYCPLTASDTLAPQALRMLLQPFLSDQRVIAVLACSPVRGALAQAEQQRRLLLPALGWSRLNALAFAEGTVGLYRKAPAAAAGGYQAYGDGRDSDLLLRLHRTQRDEGESYRVAFLPDAVAEIDTEREVDGWHRALSRWQTGLTRALWQQRDLAPQAGGVLGWLALPYTIVFEIGGPLLASAGVVCLGALAMAQALPWRLGAAVLLAWLALSLLQGASACWLATRCQAEPATIRLTLRRVSVAALESLLGRLPEQAVRLLALLSLARPRSR